MDVDTPSNAGALFDLTKVCMLVIRQITWSDVEKLDADTASMTYDATIVGSFASSQFTLAVQIRTNRKKRQQDGRFLDGGCKNNAT